MDQMSTIAVPQELYARIAEIVKRHGFASEAELIALALRALEQSDLRNQGFDIEDLEAMHAAMEELRNDPSKGRTSEEIAAGLAAEYRAALKAG